MEGLYLLPMLDCILLRASIQLLRSWHATCLSVSFIWLHFGGIASVSDFIVINTVSSHLPKLILLPINKIVSCLFQVQDLHSITPNYFLEVSGAVIHPLSYQQVG